MFVKGRITAKTANPGSPGQFFTGKKLFVIVAFLIVLILLNETGNAQGIPNFRIKEEAARESFKKGVSFYNAGQFVAAREFFYNALNVHPYFHLARRFLGDSYYYSGEWNGAIEQWTFLDELSGNAYPLVKQRSELLRFYLNRYKDPGEYVYFRSYSKETLNKHNIDRPVDLYIDNGGLLTILSYSNNSMLQVLPSGEVHGSYSGLPFFRPRGPLSLVVKDDLFFLAEYNNDRIGVYRKNGLPLMHFGVSGNNDGQFHGPSGIALTDKAIFVSDSGNNRIQKFDRNGKFIFSINKDEKGFPMRYPAGIAFDKEGLLYVADRDGKRILIFDQDGNYVNELRSELLQSPRNVEPGKKRLWIADEKSGVIFYTYDDKKWGTLNELDDGKGKNHRFNKPFSIREDNSGIVYVSNYLANRVDILTPRGFRTSNLDLKIEKIDASSYPDMAVFLTVKNRLGLPLQGLPRNNFKLFENDRRIGNIRSDNMRPFNTRANFVFVMEGSKKMNEIGYNPISATVNPIIKNIRINDRIKVVRCGEQVRKVYEGLHRLDIMRNIYEGDVSEHPNIGKGLYEGITQLLNEIGPRYVILLVSGKMTENAFSQYSRSRIIQYATSHNISINIISYELEENTELKQNMMHDYAEIAELTGGQYINAYDETELRKIYDSIRNKIDERYILTYRALDRNYLKDHYIDVRVEVTYLETMGVSDGGYFVPLEY